MTKKIPTAALAYHLIALGKTGSGKSSKLRVLVEDILDRQQPVCIIDPKGDWWGLKSSADGKTSGYPIVIFGGEHADVPLNPHAGAHVAELVATGNRSALIDLGGWMVGERTRFFIEFASTYFKLMRGARTLVLPEVHNFAPQGKILDPDAGKMLHWANRLASEGRGKGITILADSQRPQKCHKDFVTSCETLIACKVIHKLDRDAIKDWIDGCADPAKGREVIADLAQLKKPEAWVWCPEIDFGPTRMTFPLFKTYDSFKPQPADAGKLKGWASVDLDDVKARLAVVVEEAKANDPKALKARVVELERQLSKPRELAIDTQSLAEAETRGHEKGLHVASVAFYGAKSIVEEAIVSASKTLVSSLQASLRESFKETLAKLGDTKIVASVHMSAKAPLATSKAVGELVQHAARAFSKPSGNRLLTPEQAFPRESVPLPPGERATLGACIQYPDGLERSQLTVITGYKRSTRDAYIQRLVAKEYIEVRGNVVLASVAGIQALPDFEPLPRGQDLIDFWMRKLPEGEKKVLQHLIDAGGEPVQREAIDQATGYQRSSRDAYLQRLRAKQLVVDEGRGQVKASQELFA